MEDATLAASVVSEARPGALEPGLVVSGEGRPPAPLPEPHYGVVPVPFTSNGVAASARFELPSGTRSPGGWEALPR